MKVMGVYLPSFVKEVRDDFIDDGDYDIIHCVIIKLDQFEVIDPGYPAKLIGDIYSSLELDDFQPEGNIDLESPQTVIRDLIYVTVRQILWDEEFDPSTGEPSRLKEVDMQRRKTVPMPPRLVRSRE